ncbi:MAG: hypothetical protein CR967_03305 [Proteobacteria bacterium]|nr:MAG: hypothetical protein CR967_03305 [Pseudomonadota bacterium]
MDKIGLKEKFASHIKGTNYANLDEETKIFFEKVYLKYAFSFQELKQLIDFAIDFKMWQEEPMQKIFTWDYTNKKEAFSSIREIWQILKEKPNSYKNFSIPKNYKRTYSTYEFEANKPALGSCPVASESTRCCNLWTLDAVNSCGFDCSYCSIQSFYKQEKIGFDKNFAKNLKNIHLDPNKTYHIGTGQSSDSLMWGNKNGILDALFEFARENENVILEFKTKSKNIKYLLQNDVPKNIIATWSLNTKTIIKNEEHLTASLDERINSAHELAQKGVLVGFHFHPMVVYENYLQEYREIFKHLTDTFNPKDVALVSFGTLTFIKPVINKLRKRDFYSKILQMPLLDANGKYSYSLDDKRKMFKNAYEGFAPWHGKVYFYMCMEEKSLWKEVFGREYANNDEMEEDMKRAYFEKINSKK